MPMVVGHLRSRRRTDSQLHQGPVKKGNVLYLRPISEPPEVAGFPLTRP